MKLQIKKLFFIFVVIIGSILLFRYNFIFAANKTQTVNVNFTVPDNGNNGGGGGGGGGGPVNNPPIISNVNTLASVTTATITWTVKGGTGVTSLEFIYGTNENYGSNGVVTGNYAVALVNLLGNTLYFYKITEVDISGQTAVYTGTFITSDPNAPPPGDTTPPVISNDHISTGLTNATITWDTDEVADSQVQYGLGLNYGSNYFDPNQLLSHTVILANLLPGTQYHYRIISTDSAGNSANTPDSTFITDRDNIPPPDVSNFVLTTTSDSIVLSWNNPSLVGTPDFFQVVIVRKVGSASVDPLDGVTVYNGSQENFTDSNIAFNVNYFYTIFSFDTSKNRSPGIFRNGKIIPAPPAPQEICGNNIDDNNNGKVDCADVACVAWPACMQNPPPTSTPEVCGNGLDDDNNGKTDCLDAACNGFAGCINNPQVKFVCSNNLDDDADGKVDFPEDKGCDNANDNDEYNPPESTVPSFIKINLSDLIFLAGNRRIRLAPFGGQVFGLSGANLTVGVPASVLDNAPKSMVLKIGDTDQHQFVYNATDKTYYADLSFGRGGLTQSYIEIDYGSGQLDSVGFKLNALPWGQIVDKEQKGIEGVVVTLYDKGDNIFPAGYYGQNNPINTDINGSLGWLVPNDSYKVILQKEGYYERTINISNIRNNVINEKWSLIALPPKLELKIDPDASVGENIKNVAGALGQQTKILSEIGAQKIQDAITNPDVKRVNQQVVAPAAISAVVASAAPFISWVNIFPFLRFLFLQPLMLLGWRKRQKWGMVYNSLNKMPVDLAMVRLLNADTGRVVQSKVTDAKGRFIFMVGPGRYKLLAQKNSFLFPSNFLAGMDSDGKKTDIYHGEIIEVKHSSSITSTIPLDPVGAQKKPGRLVWEKFGRKLQSILGVVGFLITLASLYISPKWYIGVLLGVHVAVFVFFRKLAVPPKVKNWGLVSDSESKNPVSKVVARLFNSQFNKLVDMQVTDSDGKYHFIAGDAKYYVTYEHKDYHPQKTDIIDLEGKDAEVITKDVSLKKH